MEAQPNRTRSKPGRERLEREFRVAVLIVTATLVRAYAQGAGLDPHEFAGHSLRAGFVTSAAERGAKTDRIMDVTGHRSHAMVRTYTRRTDAFANHAGAELL
jgi:integrase